MWLTGHFHGRGLNPSSPFSVTRPRLALHCSRVCQVCWKLDCFRIHILHTAYYMLFCTYCSTQNIVILTSNVLYSMHNFDVVYNFGILYRVGRMRIRIRHGDAEIADFLDFPRACSSCDLYVWNRSHSVIASEKDPRVLWVCSSLLRINWLVSIKRSTQLTKQISVRESSFGPGLSMHFSQQTSVIWCTNCWNLCFWDSISMKCWSCGSAAAWPSIII